MVCISCIVIPVFIWIWYRFIQPILTTLKLYFYPAVKTAEESKPLNEISGEILTERSTVVDNEPKKDL
jgi:uncharacterized membrane protein (DUF106 family)